MIAAHLSNWLKSDRNYAQGLQLYLQHGDSQVLKMLFASGSTEYHQDRLFSALTELLAALPAQPAKSAKAVPALSEIHIVKDSKLPALTKYDHLPEQLKAKAQLKDQLHTRSQLIFSRLPFLDSPAERLQAALQLLDDRQQINGIWQELDAYAESGSVKVEQAQQAEKALQDLSTAELFDIAKNYPSSITKRRQRLEKLPEGAKKQTKRRELDEMSARLQYAKKRLKND